MQAMQRSLFFFHYLFAVHFEESLSCCIQKAASSHSLVYTIQNGRPQFLVYGSIVGRHDVNLPARRRAALEFHALGRMRHYMNS